MTLKRIFLTLVAVITIAVSGSCFAQATKADLCIGGISYEQPLSELIAKYGQPVEKRPGCYVFSSSEGPIEIYTRFNETVNGKVVASIIVEGNSEVATKAGIRIGSTYEEIISAYGTPSREHFGKLNNGSPNYYVSYDVIIPPPSPKHFGSTMEMCFSLDGNKKVKFIRIEELIG